MNDKRKHLLVTALVLLVMSLIGCGSNNAAAEYPVIEPVDISAMELAAIDDGALRYQVPADTWVEGVEVSGNTVALLTETVGAERQVSIRAQVVGYYDEPINEGFMNEAVDMLNQDISMNVTMTEMRSFLDTPIFYSEMSVEFTDEVIDNLLAEEIWTEEELEAVGGREFYLNIPKTNMIMIHAVIDDNMVTYGGSYFNDSQKQIVLDTINIMIQTTEIY